MQLEMEFLDASSCLHFLDGFLDAFGKLFISGSIQLKFSIRFNTKWSMDPVQIAEWIQTDPV